MRWQQLGVKLGELSPAPLEDFLLALGAQSVTLVDAGDQPVLEPAPGTTPLWQDTRLVALFEAEVDLAAVSAALLNEFDSLTRSDLAIETLEDRDWEREWLKDFKPLKFGERLWIVPTAFDPPEPDAVNITLDPGLAFGTGTHPTTALCLNWLDAHAHDVVGRTVIDYGCGSGILAIAAARLGATQVVAVDIDAQAITATRDNAERNQVAPLIEASLVGSRDLQPVPLLLANILAGPLAELASRFAELVTPGGKLIMAGILADQAESVRAAASPWFNIEREAIQDNWVLLSGTRKAD